MANPFDQFDAPAGNPFDQFDSESPSPYAGYIADVAANSPEAIAARVVGSPTDEELASQIAWNTPVPVGFGVNLPRPVAQGLMENAPRVMAPLGVGLSATGLGLPAGLALTGLAGAAGELASQGVEMQTGTRQELSLPQIGVGGLLSAVPAAPLGRIASPLIRGGIRIGEGAAIGASAPLLEAGLEGRLPGAEDFERAKAGAAFGAALGVPFAGIEALPKAPQIPKSAQILADAAKPAPLANVAAETASATQGSPYALQESINKMVNIQPNPPANAAMQSAEALEAALGTVRADTPTPGAAKASAEAILEGERVAALEAASEARRLSAQEGRIQALVDEIAGGDPVLRAQILGRREQLGSDDFLAALEAQADFRRNPANQPDLLAAEVAQVGEDIRTRSPIAAQIQQERFRLRPEFERQNLLAQSEEALAQAEAARLAQPEQVILTSSPANQQLQMLDTRPGAAQAERARLLQQIEAETPALPQVSEPMLSPQAQRMQDEFGRVNPQILGPLAGGGAGGVTGFLATERREGESEQEFQARRLLNTGLGVAGGAGLGALPQIASKAFPRASTATSVSDAVGKRLGIINDFPVIQQDVSNAKLRLDRFVNTMMRGTKMRPAFVEAKRKAEASINASMDEARIILADARGKINSLASKGPQRDALEQQLNEVFTDISKVDTLPETLRPTALKMFKLRQDKATELAALEGLTDSTRDTVLENGGNYLARNYAIFRVNNPLEMRAYKAAIPKQDMEAALDAIQEKWTPKPKSAVEQKLAADAIESAANDPVNGVAVIKSLRPWMTDNDAAKVAAWVAAGKRGGNPQVRALYGELVNPSEMSRTEAQSLLNEFLDRDSFLGFSLGRKQIGGKDITSLYQKKELDPRLRKVLGEIKDPLDNAYHSLENQVNLIERDKQQREFIKLGEEQGIFTRNPDEATQKGMVPLVESAKEQNSPYDNWTGVYTYPFLRDEFEGVAQKKADSSRLIDAGLGSIKAATAAFKWLKLIPSPDSRSVNLVGAWWNNAVNGRGLNPVRGESADAIKAILLSNGLIQPNGSANTQAIMDLRKTLVKHRVLDESTLGRDFAETFNESVLKNTFGKVDEFAQREIDNPGLRKAYLAGRFLASGKEFAAADDIMRVVGFLEEKERYRSAFPNVPDEELNEIAGRIMNQTGMTYSEVPAAIRQLSQVGILEPFTSFPFSVYRSTINTARLGAAELQDGLKSGNQQLAKIGAKRLAALSLGAAAASGYGISQMINREHGVTEEQEAAAKVFAPDYVKDSPLAFDAPVKDGKVQFVQMNYLLPSGLVTSAIEEGVNEAKKDGLVSGLEAGAGQVASQFSGFGDDGNPFGPAITTIGKAMGLINKDDFGRPIWNPQDPKKWDKVAASIGKDWAPGFLSKAERLYAANNPEAAAKYPGRVFSNQEELLRFLGRRATTVDVKKLIPTKAYGLYSDYLDASKLYSQEVSREKIAGDTEATAQAYEASENVVNERFNDMVAMVNAARTLDVPDDTIRAGLIQGGIPKRLAAQIMAEVYVPPSKERADALMQAREMKREAYQQLGATPQVTPQARPQANARQMYDRVMAVPPEQRRTLVNQLVQSGELNDALLAEMTAIARQNK